MSILHLVHHSAQQSDAFRACLAQKTQADGIVLFGDGVYLALDEQLCTSSEKLYVLESDLKSRGLDSKVNPAKIHLIDYNVFVRLVVEYDKTMSWS